MRFDILNLQAALEAAGVEEIDAVWSQSRRPEEGDLNLTAPQALRRIGGQMASTSALRGVRSMTSRRSDGDARPLRSRRRFDILALLPADLQASFLERVQLRHYAEG